MKKNLFAKLSKRPFVLMANITKELRQRYTSFALRAPSRLKRGEDHQPPSPDQKILDKIWQDPVYFLVFGFGTGLMKVAPGTWGTLAGMLVYVMIAHCSPMIYAVLTLLAFIAGVFWCDKVSRQMGVHDYPGIVWDEVVGYLITMLYAPLHISWMIIGFLLFRLFDIWKPQPIGWVDQRVKGGLGIMLDDVLAAIPAWLILHALIRIFGS